MINKRLLLFLINLLIAFSLVSYMIYRRFLIIRLPKELTFLDQENIKFPVIFFVCISIIFCFINVIHLIFLLKKKESNNIFTQISLKINIFLDNAFSDLYNFLGSFIPDLYDKVSFLCQKFYKFFQDFSETFFIFILYGIRLIILLAFLIDVFVFFKIHYMYKSFYLLIISMLIKFFFYIMKDFASNLEIVEQRLIIVPKGVAPESNLPITEYRLKKEYEHLDLDYHIGQFILCNKITGYLQIYQRYSDFFYPYINLFIYILYLCGWFYVICYNIPYI